MTSAIHLKPSRDRSLLRRHPWVFSGAISWIDGDPKMGETVEIRDSRGSFLAWGAYSPESQISLRVWSWNRIDEIDREYFKRRLIDAINYRTAVFSQINKHALDSDRKFRIFENLPSSFRLVNAESDGLPGLIIDCYGEVLVLQFLSAGAEYWYRTIVDLLVELTKSEYIYERSDAQVRKLEGLPVRVGPVFGKPQEKHSITENQLRFLVDYERGQKTGFYLDQRVNREIVKKLAHGKDILDCFSYTGGFTVNALAGDAETVTAVDSSLDALKIARENVKLNMLSEERVEWVEADVFKQLRKFRDQARLFDLIVLDPPKFAPTASQVQKAARGYKDINLLGLKLLRPGGMLVTFSCSGGVDAALFQKIIFGAALDAGVDVRIVSRLEQSPDHPVSLSFPEGNYLKGLILRVN